MSIRNMRVGDTIIPVDGYYYFDVVEVDGDTATAKPMGGKGRNRKFKADRLFCVDHDDGLWQETEN